jgi:hypothetical protein
VPLCRCFVLSGNRNRFPITGDAALSPSGDLFFLGGYLV